MFMSAFPDNQSPWSCKIGSVTLVLQLAVGSNFYLQPTGHIRLMGIVHMEETEAFARKFEVYLNVNRS